MGSFGHDRVRTIRIAVGRRQCVIAFNLVEQTFVAFVIGGMSIASLVAFSNYLPAFTAYVFPASLPLAGRLFLLASYLGHTTTWSCQCPTRVAG
jgi:hypothetical protein